MSGNNDDILGVIFLAFVAIITASLINKFAPGDNILIVPSMAFVSISLWIAYDYILRSRYKSKLACMKERVVQRGIAQQSENVEVNPEEISNLVNEINDSDDSPEPEKPMPIPPPQKQDKDEFDIDLHNKRDLRKLHTRMGCSADTQLYNRMKYTSMQPRLSQDIRAQWNKHSLKPYLEEELEEHSKREWWNSDFLEESF